MPAYPNQFMADPVKTYLQLFVGSTITVTRPGVADVTGTCTLLSSNAFVVDSSGTNYIYYTCWAKGVTVDDLENPTALTVLL